MTDSKLGLDLQDPDQQQQQRHLEDDNQGKNIDTQHCFDRPQQKDCDASWDSSRAMETILSAFQALPKTGKPQNHEHTILAAILVSFPNNMNPASTLSPLPADHHQQQQQQQQIESSTTISTVLCMATGTKCLPGSKRCPAGCALNDCHAEVLCRRLLLRWLLSEISQIATTSKHEKESHKESKILRLAPTGSNDSGLDCGFKNEGPWKVEVQPGVEFHLVVSQPPCGDASIVLIDEKTDDKGKMLIHPGKTLDSSNNLNHNHSNDGDDGNTTNTTTTAAAAVRGIGLESSGRTGAKPLVVVPKVTSTDGEGGKEECCGVLHVLPTASDVESYAAPQAIGLVRRKPGKGEPTLSMSCSDKIAKWGLLGLQGSFLSGIFSQPLPLSTLTVGTACSPAELSSSTGNMSSIENKVAATGVALERAVVMRTKAPRETFLSRSKEKERKPSRGTVCDVVVVVPHPPRTYATSVQLDVLQNLGLAPSEQRKVPSGASLLWRAPPSKDWKNPKIIIKSPQHAQQPHLSLTFTQPSTHNTTNNDNSTNNVLDGSCAKSTEKKEWWVLPASSGSAEVVAGGTGVKLGFSRKKSTNTNTDIKNNSSSSSSLSEVSGVLKGAVSVCKWEIAQAWLSTLRLLLENNRTLGAAAAAGDDDRYINSPDFPQEQQTNHQQQQQQQQGVKRNALGEELPSIDVSPPAPLPAPKYLKSILNFIRLGLEEERASPGETSEENITLSTVKERWTYGEIKEAVGKGYQGVWRELVAPGGCLGVFEGWIPKPPELEYFQIFP